MIIGAAEQKDAPEAEALALLGCSTAMNSHTCYHCFVKCELKTLSWRFHRSKDFLQQPWKSSHCWFRFFFGCCPPLPLMGDSCCPWHCGLPLSILWHEFTPCLWLQYCFLESPSPKSFWDLSACLFSTFLLLPGDRFIPFWAEW